MASSPCVCLLSSALNATIEYVRRKPIQAQIGRCADQKCSLSLQHFDLSDSSTSSSHAASRNFVVGQSYVDTPLDTLQSTQTGESPFAAPALPAWPAWEKEDSALPTTAYYKDLRNAPLHHGPDMTASSSSPSRPPFPSIATKASSTAQSSQLNAVADSKLASGPRSSSRISPNAKFRQDVAGQDPISERATWSLIRRILVADGSHGTDPRASPTPIEGVLPPLTSSNEVDVQLYAIVAIVIKDFVNSWYSKITPDRAFVDEVIQIIAHCSRALEQRIRQIDMTALILDELPVLIERHIAGEHEAWEENVVLQVDMLPSQHTGRHPPHRPLCSMEKIPGESITP